MNGAIVEVIDRVPNEDFFLPDGYPHYGAESNHWVIKSLGSLFEARLGEDGVRKTRFGVANGIYLKPLPGLSKEIEESNYVQ